MGENGRPVVFPSRGSNAYLSRSSWHNASHAAMTQMRRYHVILSWLTCVALLWGRATTQQRRGVRWVGGWMGGWDVKDAWCCLRAKKQIASLNIRGQERQQERESTCVIMCHLLGRQRLF